jgi:hypothetical protein
MNAVEILGHVVFHGTEEHTKRILRENRGRDLDFRNVKRDECEAICCSIAHSMGWYNYVPFFLITDDIFELLLSSGAIFGADEIAGRSFSFNRPARTPCLNALRDVCFYRMHGFHLQMASTIRCCAFKCILSHRIIFHEGFRLSNDLIDDDRSSVRQTKKRRTGVEPALLKLPASCVRIIGRFL